MGLSWLLLASVGHSTESFPESSTDSSEPTIEVLSQMSLEDLAAMQIKSISRVDEPLDTAAGSIYAYPAKLIRERGYRSLGELLQSVPGFTVFHKDLQYVVGVRGFNANDNDKVSLLVNGQRVLGMHEQEFLNGPINLDNIERVEVIVGPSSLFYPATTLAATINVITKKPEGSEVSAATGNALPYSVTFATGRKWAEDRFVAFSFTTETKEGFDAWNPQFRPGLADQKDTGKLEWPSYFSVLNGQYGEFSGQIVLYRSALPELNINSASPQNDGRMTEEFYSALVKNEHP